MLKEYCNMEKQSKREILAQYKNRKVIGGVFVIKNNVNGKMLVLSAADLDGFKNRFAFSQSTGSCVNFKIQKDWDEFGAKAFEFEVLEELEKQEIQTDKEFGDDIKVLKDIWFEKFDKSKLY